MNARPELAPCVTDTNAESGTPEQRPIAQIVADIGDLCVAKTALPFDFIVGMDLVANSLAHQPHPQFFRPAARGRRGACADKADFAPRAQQERDGVSNAGRKWVRVRRQAVDE